MLYAAILSLMSLAGLIFGIVKKRKAWIILSSLALAAVVAVTWFFYTHPY